MMAFDYIKERYKVPAEMFREVIVAGSKGVITEDMGNYIGVQFYNDDRLFVLPCHPEWKVEYLESFNYKPKKPTASKRRYQEYLKADSGLTFGEWLGIKPKAKEYKFH